MPNYFISLINDTVINIRCNIFFKFGKDVISSDKFNYFRNIRIFLKRVIIIIPDNIIDFLI